ncbi:tail fiber domain-containing protein [Pleionea litopenaei]|uniref:Peptidase S74 domain-containing protein n=1 Tax=Pleionea litopenaei TaxID=3070815 RepID=A0AA51X6M8_9GAMM|nr:tail fiber domain-containing protein [Pleionea sp. HL-JVS1]WMS87293.1 hypothetical protein Q9312_18980 [Pleionea sp. HL-JVS1]
MRKSAISSAVAVGLFGALVIADQVINDDLIVTFSECVGNDCVNGENFGFDTIRMKENNTRLKFDDTSSSGSFPSNDWTIVANDSNNGGASYLAIEDATAGRIPFRVEAGARANAMVVESDGDVGFGTLNPAVDLHYVNGNTPTLRLDQDGSSGFTSQAWDVGGNEANFFIRDVTNGSRLPFRIRPGAPESSLDIQANGEIGMGTSSPESPLHVRGNVASLEPILTLENTNTSNGFVRGIKIVNNGGSIISFEDTNPGPGLPSGWNMQSRHDDGSFGIANATGVGQEFSLSYDGNLTISGDLIANGTTYTSSRISKENFSNINVFDILNTVASLDILKWNYIRNSDNTLHIGPMAEDFHAAFGLNGEAKDRISVSDVNGVALASIQALKQKLDQKDAEISELKKEMDDLKALVEKLVK